MNPSGTLCRTLREPQFRSNAHTCTYTYTTTCTYTLTSTGNSTGTKHRQAPQGAMLSGCEISSSHVTVTTLAGRMSSQVEVRR